jgi:hypothetical protein
LVGDICHCPTGPRQLAAEIPVDTRASQARGILAMFFPPNAQTDADSTSGILHTCFRRQTLWLFEFNLCFHSLASYDAVVSQMFTEADSHREYAMLKRQAVTAPEAESVRYPCSPGYLATRMGVMT